MLILGNVPEVLLIGIPKSSWDAICSLRCNNISMAEAIYVCLVEHNEVLMHSDISCKTVQTEGDSSLKLLCFYLYARGRDCGATWSAARFHIYWWCSSPGIEINLAKVLTAMCSVAYGNHNLSPTVTFSVWCRFQRSMTLDCSWLSLSAAAGCGCPFLCPLPSAYGAIVGLPMGMPVWNGTACSGTGRDVKLTGHVHPLASAILVPRGWSPIGWFQSCINERRDFSTGDCRWEHWLYSFTISQLCTMRMLWTLHWPFNDKAVSITLLK